MKKTLMIIAIIGIIFLAGCSEKEQDTQIANPASEFCIEQGGRLEIVEGDEGQTGICVLEDGTECEEWAYFRGECGPESEWTICTEEQKAAEMCTMEYMPVCGDDNVTYGNKCTACSSGKIDSWKEGEC